jgi:rubrerythrin
MMQWTSVDEILSFAIEREEEAANFYKDQAAVAIRPEMRQTFSDFAKEEMGHRAKLLAVKEGRHLMPSLEKVQNLRLADYYAPVPVSPDMRYEEILLLAMQREKAAFKLYLDLAHVAPDSSLKHTFESLAQEEAKHKLRFELEYDREHFKEN